VQHEGEHPVDSFEQASEPPGFVTVDQDLGIRMSAETMAFGDQLFAEFRVIIQLAVRDEVDGTLFVADRLMPRLHVDNGKALDAQCRTRSEEGTPMVGTPVTKSVQHPLEVRRIALGVLEEIDHTRNAAHG